jgi:hypothetical protein
MIPRDLAGPAAVALLLASLTAASAWAQDSPVATAPPAAAPNAPASTAAAPMSTADQIEAFIHDAPPVQMTKGEMNDLATSAGQPRRIHGFVDVGMGTGGYRSVLAGADVPLGHTGTVSLAVGDVRFRGLGPYGYGYGYRGFAPYDAQSALIGADPEMRRFSCRAPYDGGPTLPPAPGQIPGCP